MHSRISKSKLSNLFLFSSSDPDSNQNPEKDQISKVISLDDDEVVCLDGNDDVIDENEVVCLNDDDDDDDDDEVVCLSSDDEPPCLKMQPEVRRWTAGDYTVLLDKVRPLNTTFNVLSLNQVFT
jgi:hypothetical protein